MEILTASARADQVAGQQARVLEIATSTYYAAKKREHVASPRAARDEYLKKEIMRVWKDRRKGRSVYGARKVCRQLRREGIGAARCTVGRLMGELGIAGAVAGRKKGQDHCSRPGWAAAAAPNTYYGFSVHAYAHKFSKRIRTVQSSETREWREVLA